MVIKNHNQIILDIEVQILHYSINIFYNSDKPRSNTISTISNPIVFGLKNEKTSTLSQLTKSTPYNIINDPDLKNVDSFDELDDF